MKISICFVIFTPASPSLVELLSEEQGERDEDQGNGNLEGPEGDGDVVAAVGAAVALQLEVDPARQDVHHSEVSRALHFAYRLQTQPLVLRAPLHHTVHKLTGRRRVGGVVSRLVRNQLTLAVSLAH